MNTRYAQRQRQSTSIFSSSGEEEDGGIEDFDSKRMDLVRSLQRSFYSDDAQVDDSGVQTMEDDTDTISMSSTKTTSFYATTGKINNLPLWRVGWVETPGRRNCLNVHEMHYTHMFQKILSQSKPDEPLYFGKVRVCIVLS